MDQIYELIMDTLVCYSHTLNFPELVIPAVHQVCKDYCREKLYSGLFKKTVVWNFKSFSCFSFFKSCPPSSYVQTTSFALNGKRQSS